LGVGLGLRALPRVPLSGALVKREFQSPCTHSTLTVAGRALGFANSHEITIDSIRDI